ncbi:MAG: flagellar biosynthetic protein FliO [Pisciglobus halotolerans]|nr:flagellar biosynthetic protein FliO [Pisciglobus halotolerans]
MNFGMGMGYVLKSIVALIIIIYLANVLLKYLNKLSTKQTQMMVVIERMPVSKTASLCIVKIVETYYVISFSEGKTELLKTLSDEETMRVQKLQAEKETVKQTVSAADSFKTIFETVLQTHSEKRNRRG